MPRGAAVALMLVTALAAAPAPALAQTAPADAAALVKQGLALRRERRDADALDAFRRAYAIDAAPRTLAQLALAEQALGRWVDAEHDLQAALAADDPWIASNRRLLGAGLAAIRSHLGSLDVEADVAGAELWVNGARVGRLPLAAPLRVEAGSVIVEVRAEGYAAARRVTSVEPGGSARETVHLVAVAGPSPLPEPPAPPPPRPPVQPPPPPAPTSRDVPVDRPMRATAFVLLGAGAAGLAMGTTFGVRTFSAKADRDRNCPNGCSPQGVAFDQEARTFATRSTAWFAAGLVAAGVGAGLLWVSRSHVVVLDVGPDRATASLGGSW